jgi:hypothetical protein
MENAPTITNDTEPVDSAPDAGADSIGASMEAAYDRVNPDQGSEPESGHVSSDEEYTESFEPEQPAETVESTGVRMPQAWSKEQAEVWNSLTSDAQRYVAERELQAQRRISELGNLAKRGDWIEEFESYRSHGAVPLGNDGQPLSASQVVESALEFDHLLRQNPVETIARLAHAHGVDLGGLAGVQAPQGVDPQYIRQQVLDEVAQQQAQQQAHQYAAKEQWLRGELERYTAGKEDYWDKIEGEIIAQVSLLRSMNPARLQSDPLPVLKEAEQRALRITGLDPDAKSKAAEQKKKADEARRLASMNVGRCGVSGRSSVSNQSWETTLADTYDKIHSYRR